MQGEDACSGEVACGRSIHGASLSLILRLFLFLSFSHLTSLSSDPLALQFGLHPTNRLRHACLSNPTQHSFPTLSSSARSPRPSTTPTRHRVRCAHRTFLSCASGHHVFTRARNRRFVRSTSQNRTHHLRLCSNENGHPRLFVFSSFRTPTKRTRFEDQQPQCPRRRSNVSLC